MEFKDINEEIVENFKFTEGQQEAIDKIKDWYLNGSGNFKLSGSAGTGKSTIISMVPTILGLEDNEVVYTTYTGKASVVLNNKGVPSITLHKLMYDLVGNEGENNLKFELKEKLDDCIKLIILDEASFIGKDIMRDLFSFNKRVLIVGDNNQLPPVGEEGGILDNPDYTLKEILRQAEDNPIIKLSQHILKKGYKIKEGKLGDRLFIVNRDKVDYNLLLKSNQILVGKNDTRKMVNKDIRQLLGYNTVLPSIGEKLICTRNNWSIYIDGNPLINGTVGYCEGIKDTSDDYFYMKFRPEYSDVSYTLKVDKHFFLGKELPKRKLEGNLFEWGYAITVHKAQGSEYDNVVLYCDKMPPKMMRRWLYTGVTRAKKGLLVLL